MKNLNLKYLRYRLDRRLRRRRYLVQKINDFVRENPDSIIVNEIDAGGTYQSSGPRFMDSKGDISYSDPDGLELEAPPVQLMKFDNTVAIGGADFVSRDPVAIINNHFSPKVDMFRHEVLNIARYLPDQNVLEETIWHDEIESDLAISLLGECTGNYAHWIFETLPKLLIYNDYPELEDATILLDEGIHPVFHEMIAVCDKHSRPITTVKLGQRVKVKSLYTVTPTSHTPPENRDYLLNKITPSPDAEKFVFSPAIMKRLRNQVASLADRFAYSKETTDPIPHVVGITDQSDENVITQKVVQISGPGTEKVVREKVSAKRIYLQRTAVSAGNPRALLNTETVENILQEYGFVAIDPARLTFSQQVNLMRNAEIVVGAIGAAFSNITFAPEGCKVIGLSPYYKNADYYYFSNFLSAAGHDLVYVIGPQLYQPERHIQHRDYFADIAALKLALEKFGISKVEFK